MSESSYPLKGELLEARRAMARSRPPLFFKYLGAEGLRAVLSSGKIRFCDPRTFNDPFDVQLDYRVGFTWDEFEDSFSSEIVRLAFSPEEPRLDPSRFMFPFVKLFRAMARQHPDSRDHLELAARLSVRESRPKFESSLARANADWQGWLSTIRLFCVAEECDSLLMWAHYGRSHEGGVLALRAIPEMDSFLLAAEPVVYRDDLPVLLSLENWTQRATAQVADTVFRDYVLVKSSCWSYEREWRAFGSVESQDDPYRYSELLADEVAAVYLGCRMSEKDRQEIPSLARHRFPRAIVYQSRRSASRFGLEFDELP